MCQSKLCQLGRNVTLFSQKVFFQKKMIKNSLAGGARMDTFFYFLKFFENFIFFYKIFCSKMLQNTQKTPLGSR